MSHTENSIFEIKLKVCFLFLKTTILLFGVYPFQILIKVQVAKFMTTDDANLNFLFIFERTIQNRCLLIKHQFIKLQTTDDYRFFLWKQKLQPSLQKELKEREFKTTISEFYLEMRTFKKRQVLQVEIHTQTHACICAHARTHTQRE